MSIITEQRDRCILHQVGDERDCCCERCIESIVDDQILAEMAWGENE